MHPANIAARLAQLDKRQSVERKAVGSKPGRTIN